MENNGKLELIFDMIADTIQQVLSTIEEARTHSPYPERSVKLIAVTKTKPVEIIREAYDCDLRDFGENRVQELISKWDEFPNDVQWHLIGHLQTNKVKYIIDRVAMIHSLDSLRLAKEIEKKAAAIDRVIPVLIQVNMAQEETKFGFEAGEVPDFLSAVCQLPHLQILGLMTVAPFVDDPEENRVVFRAMRELQQNLNALALPHVEMKELSMGMSNDYRIAVEEGATMVRVGTTIFGAR